jgi:adenosylcobinamide-phosphate synthase
MVVIDRYFTQDFWALGAFPLGFALDLVLGDPRGWPHPVRVIGRLISVAERGLRVAVVRSGGGARRERLAGVILTVVVVGLVASLVWLLTEVLSQFGGPATLIGRTLLIYWGLAIRSLGRETLKASEAPTLLAARQELSMIVGRDTGKLEPGEIYRACVETIGENTSDAIVAPLFWLAVLGPAGLWGYKAVNTLDSMVGYRNARYRNFGWASAKLDDLANLVPARLTWLLIAVSAALLNEDGLASLRIGWRDGRKHPSPNAGWGEAAMAGALGVRLGGPASYGGVPSMKPLLGDPGEPIDRATVRRAVRIMYVVALHAAALSLAAKIIVFGT